MTELLPDGTGSNINTSRLAMLIDGDNAQPSLIGLILAETSKYGTVIVRRIYGDWTEANMSSWKDALHTHAIQPIQQFRYTVGKNATDSALIIDAMDILHTMRIDGFCIVSSDSDYTRLATRIREKGLRVIGIGKKLTPRAFVNACDVFVYTENLQTAGDDKRKKKQPETMSPELTILTRRAFDLSVQESGWAHLGAFGQHLRQLDPGFDPRTYGFKQLSLLVEAYPDVFEIRKHKGSGFSPIEVRMKS